MICFLFRYVDGKKGFGAGGGVLLLLRGRWFFFQRTLFCVFLLKDVSLKYVSTRVRDAGAKGQTRGEGVKSINGKYRNVSQRSVRYVSANGRTLTSYKM